MLWNYLKVALRSLLRNKGYSLINIAGLTIGLTCCFLIMMYVINEVQFERCHVHRDRIYRVVLECNIGGEIMHLAPTITPAGPAILEDFPEVTDAVRLRPMTRVLINRDEERFREESFFFADSAFFNVFSHSLLSGDSNTALDEPYSVVITEDVSRKFFGDEDAIGQTLTYENQYEFKVTGVLAELSAPTQIKANMIASFSSLKTMAGIDIESWGQAGETFLYIMLADGANASELEQKLPDMLKRHTSETISQIFTLHLQPLSRIYLHSNLMGELEPKGDVTVVYLFSAIAVVILLIACINFMNLATARSMRRAREVGMRKTLGACRSQLVGQFLGESILVTLIAIILAVIAFEMVLPSFSKFLGKEFSADIIHNIWLLPAIIGAACFVGLIAGSYPAFFLSRFRPVKTLKGGAAISSSKSMLRKSLVIFQFSTSIALIVATFVILDQLRYARNMDLGFDKEQVVVIDLDNPLLQQQSESIKNEFLKHQKVINVTGASVIPASNNLIKYAVRAEGINEDDIPAMQVIATDHNYAKTLGLTFVEGRDFSDEFATDATEAYILNQRAAEILKGLGWDDPIGKQFSIRAKSVERQREGRIIGVVKDFHMLGVRQKIEPAFLMIQPWVEQLAVRISTQDVPATLEYLEHAWEIYAVNTPFEYTFMDENYEKMYHSEERLSRIFASFSMLAVVIACLGLFGLAAFSAEQRTKEVGIRKVLGATVTGIVKLLSREFLVLVVIANLIAWPVAWYAMNRWLENFAYRISLSLWLFVAAGLLALMITALTVSFQAIKAAISDPVKSLRYE
jgi:putative ABC transport system permease protein